MFKSQINANVRYNELLIESDEAYKKLKKYSVKIEELAIVEERNRIALILHNSIGHSLTSIMISLQAEKMELVSKKQIDKDAFATVERLIQEAMKLLRRTIESADDFMKDIPFDDLMDMFIREASNNTKVIISYNSSHTSFIQDEQKSVIFNVVIESITNAMKHSGCKKIQVNINGNANEIRISISDDGCGFDAIKYGYGITKMKEQIQQIGGKYEVISKEGCKIRAILPINDVKVDV
jgi:signal transduction histidine kinase